MDLLSEEPSEFNVFAEQYLSIDPTVSAATIEKAFLLRVQREARMTAAEQKGQDFSDTFQSPRKNQVDLTHDSKHQDSRKRGRPQGAKTRGVGKIGRPTKRRREATGLPRSEEAKVIGDGVVRRVAARREQRWMEKIRDAITSTNVAMLVMSVMVQQPQRELLRDLFRTHVISELTSTHGPCPQYSKDKTAYKTWKSWVTRRSDVSEHDQFVGALQVAVGQISHLALHVFSSAGPTGLEAEHRASLVAIARYLLQFVANTEAILSRALSETEELVLALAVQLYVRPGQASCNFLQAYPQFKSKADHMQQATYLWLNENKTTESKGIARVEGLKKINSRSIQPWGVRRAIRELPLPELNVTKASCGGAVTNIGDYLRHVIEHPILGHFMRYDNKAGQGNVLAGATKFHYDAASLDPSNPRAGSFQLGQVVLLCTDADKVTNVLHHHPIFLAEKKGDGKVGVGDSRTVLLQGLQILANTFVSRSSYVLPRKFDASRLSLKHAQYSAAPDRVKPVLSYEDSPFLMGYRYGEPELLRSIEQADTACDTLEDGLCVEVALEPFFFFDLLGCIDALNHCGHTATFDSGASMYLTDLPTFASGDELKYRTRLSDAELQVRLRTIKSISEDGERWEVESEKIRASGGTEAEVERKLALLSRRCHGSRGPTPLTRLLLDIRAFGIEPLHIFINLCNISIESACRVLYGFNILTDVRAVAPADVLFLFDAESRDGAKSDHYSDNGNTRKMMLLHWEDMLAPVAERAYCERNSNLMRVYDQLWEFFRCLASVLKATMTLKADKYATHLERLKRDVEQWVQILLFQSQDLYNTRSYVELARYVVPLLAG
jgi:hypothetical protein